MLKRGYVVAGLLILAIGLFVAIAYAQQNPSFTNVASVTAPASYAVAITPSNSVDLTVPCRAIYVGGAGNITVDMLNSGTNLAFNGAVAGSTIAIRVKRVYSTGTSATSLLCLY